MVFGSSLNFKKQSQIFLKQVREHQTIIDAISAERLVVVTQLAETERAIAAQKSRLATTLQNDLNSVLLELNSQLQSIAQRRRDISSSETNKLHSLRGILGSQVSDLDRRIFGLNQQEAIEKNAASNALQGSHVQNYLRGHYISNSYISGIGATYKAKLAYSGFVTAADIDHSVSRVTGIGTIRLAALLQWRQSLEYQALRSVPTLQPQERQAIESKYRQARQTHESERQQLQTQLSSQIASARQYFSDARQSLNAEEQQLRSASTQKKITIQQLHDAEVSTLDNQAVAARNQATPTINELSEKLRAAQKQTFALRWQSAKREKEGRRFAALRFPNYLRTMVRS